MTDDIPDDIPAEPSALDLGAITVEDADTSGDDFGTPNHKASKPRRRAWKAGSEKVERPAEKRAPIPKRKGQFVAPLTQIYVSVGMMLMPMDPICANAILSSAENCAKSLDELAYQNESVRRALYSLTQTSATAAVLMAHAPILMAIAMHHVPAVQRYAGSLGTAMSAEDSADSSAVA